MQGAGAGDRYLETRILSATPDQLVVILYDHLLTQLQRTRLAIEIGKDDVRLTALDRARAAVGELTLTLDMEKGGAIAAQLEGLYAFLLSELVDMGMYPDEGRLDRVVAMVQELRDAFDAAARSRAGQVPVS